MSSSRISGGDEKFGVRNGVSEESNDLPDKRVANDNGELFLEPAFVVSAPPFPPRLDGPYRLIGEDEDGDAVPAGCGLVGSLTREGYGGFTRMG